VAPTCRSFRPIPHASAGCASPDCGHRMAVSGLSPAARCHQAIAPGGKIIQETGLVQNTRLRAARRPAEPDSQASQPLVPAASPAPRYRETSTPARHCQPRSCPGHRILKNIGSSAVPAPHQRSPGRRGSAVLAPMSECRSSAPSPSAIRATSARPRRGHPDFRCKRVPGGAPETRISIRSSSARVRCWIRVRARFTGKVIGSEQADRDLRSPLPVQAVGRHARLVPYMPPPS
jgi:hypothetical protein